MLKHKGHIAGLVASAVMTFATTGIVAATSSNAISPVGFCASAVAVPSGNSQHPNEALAEIGQIEPSFGGLRLSADGEGIEVYLLDVGRETRARQAITDVLTPRITIPTNIRILQAQYSILKLKGWYDCTRDAVWNVPGVVGSDLDEAANSIWYGVLDETARQEVVTLMERLGVPHDTFVVQVTERPTAQYELNDRYRPLAGGLRVEVQTAGGYCTFGFHAVRQGVQGAVIPSHCTWSKWGADGSSRNLYQDVSGSGNVIGTGEVADPPMFTSAVDSYCPQNKQCRYSDAAFWNIDVNSSDILFGYIHKTTSGTTIDTNAQWRIVSHQPPLYGQSVTKVGRVTGTTSGTITQTCADIEPYTNSILLCQYTASYTSNDGDSGSPVFSVLNSPQINDVRFRGMHGGRWLGDAYFSGMMNMEGWLGNSPELGDLTICASSFSC